MLSANVNLWVEIGVDELLPRVHILVQINLDACPIANIGRELVVLVAFVFLAIVVLLDGTVRVLTLQVHFVHCA